MTRDATRPVISQIISRVYSQGTELPLPLALVLTTLTPHGRVAHLCIDILFNERTMEGSITHGTITGGNMPAAEKNGISSCGDLNSTMLDQLRLLVCADAARGLVVETVKENSELENGSCHTPRRQCSAHAGWQGGMRGDYRRDLVVVTGRRIEFRTDSGWNSFCTLWLNAD